MNFLLFFVHAPQRKVTKESRLFFLNLYMEIAWIVIANLSVLVGGFITFFVDRYTYNEENLPNYEDRQKSGRKKSIWQIAGLFLVILGAVANAVLATKAKMDNDTLTSNINTLKQNSHIISEGVSTANESLLGLKISDIKTFKNQVASFKETAERIQNSADTLLKYINGDVGYGYVDIKLGPDGKVYFKILNPNRYTLKNIELNLYSYVDYVSAIQVNDKGDRFLSKNDLDKIAIFSGGNIIATPGTTTLKTKPIIGNTSAFIVTINIGDKIYVEELLIDYVEKMSWLRLYQSNGISNYKFVIQIPKSINVKNWNKIFTVSLDRIYYAD